MESFSIKTVIHKLNTCAEFCKEFKIGKGDLVFVSGGTYSRHFKKYLSSDAYVINYRKYGSGEPTDTMVESIYNEVKDYDYNRVIAIGGGTILDVAKLFALKNIIPVVSLFEKKIEIEKIHELVLVPTTCGTGSEVTNISILELTAINSKFGLAVDQLYADSAVLIPELLAELPTSVFATSSIDALIHAIESFTSPKANSFTRIFSKKAMKMILTGYQKVVNNNGERTKELMTDFLLASTYAGIAFGNAGCAAVHAMSYPLGAAYHVPHGEANYVMFTGVYKTYMALKPDGILLELNNYLAKILDCRPQQIYEQIEVLLNKIIMKKPISSYGVTKEELETFAELVVTKQTRLMSNNYVPLNKEQVLAIYNELY